MQYRYSRTAQVLLVITSVVTIATTRFVYKASTGLIASGTTHEHAYLCSLHNTTDAWSSVLRHVKYFSNSLCHGQYVLPAVCLLAGKSHSSC